MDAHVLVLGAGPGGLSAAYALLKQNCNVTILERGNRAGGLMQAVKYEDYMVDFGYKHVYSRIAEVQALWESVLGDDFKRYVPRTGVLYKNYILEKDKRFKGVRRGMPIHLLLKSFADLVKNYYKFRSKPVITLQDFAYAKRGEEFTRIFTQGFDERIKCRQWTQLSAPLSTSNGEKNFLKRFFKEASNSVQGQPIMFHPSKGTGQISEVLEREIRKMGGNIHYQQEVTQIEISDKKVVSVQVKNKEGVTNYQTGSVVSCLPLQVSAKLLGFETRCAVDALSFRRSVILVYFFLSDVAPFPHTCIQVSDPELAMSRITNFGAYPCSMVPPGKGCLCIEFFCVAEDVLMQQSDVALMKLALKEASEAGLVKPQQVMHHMVIKCPGADPANSWEDYKNEPQRAELYEKVNAFHNMYQVGRTGTDKSTYAGLMAAEAIMQGSKKQYNIKTQPDVFYPWQENEKFVASG